jgi:hypothetical protein
VESFGSFFLPKKSPALFQGAGIFAGIELSIHSNSHYFQLILSITIFKSAAFMIFLRSGFEN